MADDDNPDRILSDTPDFTSSNQPDQRTDSTSLGDVRTGETIADDSLASAQPASSGFKSKEVQDVVNSDIGVSTLLNRLKQSIASAKEFALFLKKRSVLEEEHSNGLKKLCRATAENIRRPEHRHGSFLQSYEAVTHIHERMADNGAQFATSLQQMHEDLLEMTANIERGRKHWKTTGLAAEQRVADTEAAMRKSKAKYDSLAEDYDRAKTGGGQSGKKFGLKGPKSQQQHEEDLLRKLQAADSDYTSKVQTAQSQRSELWSKSRPEAVKSLEDLIRECDSALTLQMQKFASFNEKLLLSNGLNISPLKGSETGSQLRSLREVVHSIDNEGDLSHYIGSYHGKVPLVIPEIQYEKHRTLQSQQYVSPASAQRQSNLPSPVTNRPGPPQQFSSNQTQSPHQSHASQPFNMITPPVIQQRERSFSHGSSDPQLSGPMGGSQRPTHIPAYNSGAIGNNGPPQISTLPFQASQAPTVPIQQHNQTSSSTNQPLPVSHPSHLPPLKPVFGLRLEHLFERDQSAVPMVVYQCIQAVDLFGLEVEGIYRLSGTASHITNIKAMFDNDASKVDFRDPASFSHDVNSVAGLLKQFFRDLPDPLLTSEHYAGFVEAAKHDDDIVRRDSLHAIINALPDPNYATLRALILHLNRVQRNAAVNRMNASNLAIVFGPTLMGAHTGPNINDAGLQVRVIDTILQNAYQIFDDD